MLIGIDASRTTASQRTGTETYSLHLIRELLSLGERHRFRLYFRRPPPPSLFGREATGFASGSVAGDAHGLRPEASGEHGPARNPPQGMPYESRVIPFPRLWTHVRLSWEMARRPPDVLFVPAHVLPLVHPKRSAVTVHDLGFAAHPEAHTRFQRWYLGWSTRFNARSAARVVADSQATRGDLERLYGIPPERIAVAYPGRDETLGPVTEPAELGAMREQLGLRGPYLLYVGTLQPRKNLSRLVEAFAMAAGGLDPAMHLVLAGRQGWLSEPILTQIRVSGLQGRVLLPGYMPAQHLAALYSAATAFVYPSLYEGFGLPVLEAMACGTPVLCSDSSSLPEVAGDAALLVDPTDTAAMASALIQIAENGGLRQILVKRGFRQVQQFSWQRCAREVLAVLEEVGRDAG
jgi:glycosyltransferase involved in cell wall biosynthesis